MTRLTEVCMTQLTEVCMTRLPEVPYRILDPANGKPCLRQCRAMANEYIRGLIIGSCEAANSCREYSIEPTVNAAADIVWR